MAKRSGVATCALLALATIQSGCNYQVRMDAPATNDIIVRVPSRQDDLQTRIDEVDHLMQADTPLTAQSGVDAFNNLVRASSDYYLANFNTNEGAIVAATLAKSLPLALELRRELLARYPQKVHDAEPCTDLYLLYSQPGTWIGPKNYLAISP